MLIFQNYLNTQLKYQKANEDKACTVHSEVSSLLVMHRDVTEAGKKKKKKSVDRNKQ